MNVLTAMVKSYNTCTYVCTVYILYYDFYTFNNFQYQSLDNNYYIDEIDYTYRL